MGGRVSVSLFPGLEQLKEGHLTFLTSLTFVTLGCVILLLFQLLHYARAGINTIKHNFKNANCRTKRALSSWCWSSVFSEGARWQLGGRERFRFIFKAPLIISANLIFVSNKLLLTKLREGG